MANEIETIVFVSGIVIVYLAGIGTQWAAFKRVFGSGARLLLATSNAIEDDHIDASEVVLVGQKAEKFVWNLKQFWKAVFGR